MIRIRSALDRRGCSDFTDGTGRADGQGCGHSTGYGKNNGSGDSSDVFNGWQHLAQFDNGTGDDGGSGLGDGSGTGYGYLNGTGAA
jgi:hypothetical protein